VCEPIDAGVVEQGRNVIEAQSELTVGEDPVQALDGRRPVTPVRRAPAPLLRLQQPDAVVVVERSYSYPRQRGQLSNRVAHLGLGGDRRP
jgi:hypothetical protein